MTKFQDSFSEEVWLKTYKHYEDKTIDDTLLRVATAVADVENTNELKDEWKEKFYDMLSDFKVVPGGRILSNAGSGYEGTGLLNCFVLPQEKHDVDSIQGISNMLLNQMLTLKSEGGIGINLSMLRPRGCYINGIGVSSPGAIKFAELFDKSSEIITSGSGLEETNKKAKKKIRKGAQMLVLDVSHPDILEFVVAKQQAGRLTKFNISVNCSDAFMSAVKNDEDWQLQFPDTTFKKYKEEWDGNLAKWKDRGYPVITHKTIKARDLWDKIIHSTYNRAEPGILFLDRANKTHCWNYDERAHINKTNPCAEQCLPSGGSCNLSSINLTQFYDTKTKKFDFEKLKKYTAYAVRFLDNVNDIANAPLGDYEAFSQKARRIGLGIMGWGSLLYMMKIPFSSKQADELRDDIMQTLTHNAIKTSIELAKERGMFEWCNKEKHAKAMFWDQINLPQNIRDEIAVHGIRNSSLFSIQPTGNTGILANTVSGGLEPIFMPEYIRTVILEYIPKEIANVCPKWYEGEWYETDLFKFAKEGDEEILKGTTEDGTVYKIDKNRGLTKEVLCEDYGVRFLKSINEWDSGAKWAKTTTDITVDEHVSDLNGFSRWLDSACSKTINIPNDYPFEAFKDVYMNVYNSGYAKGCTTYRAGTMTSVLSKKEDEKSNDEEIIYEDVKLPNDADARVKVIRAEGKKWYLTVVSANGNFNRPFALFVKTNHKEPTIQAMNAVDHLLELAHRKGIKEEHIEDVRKKISTDNNADKVARSISLLLRHGVLIKNIVMCLDGVEDVFVGTFLFQIKKFLSQFIKDGERVDGETCDECGGQIIYQEGCFKCSSCGTSKCG